jgi:membrane protein
MVDEALRNLRAVAPAEVVSIVRQQFEKLASGGASGKLLTLGIVGALWSSSAAMMAIIDTLNRAYDIAERRPWWKARLVAIFLTLVLSVFITVSLSLLLAGPTLLSWLGAGADREGPGRLLWSIVHWPVAGLLVVLAIDLIYYAAPNRKTAWVWVTPGSLLATVLWIATSLGFRLYVINIGNYNATYGTIGAIIVLMLWLYLSGLSILIGAELNAEIDHALAAAKKEAGGG